MKKTCICIFFVVSCVFSLSAWSLLSLSPSRPECVTDELNKLLEQKHFEKDSDAIIGFTKDFSLADRQAIFDYYKLDGEKAADDNYNWYFPCFGFGSFAEGDSKGGVILLVSDIVFWGTAYTGTFMFCFSLFDMFGLTAPVHEVAGQTGYDVERSKSLMIGGLIAAGVGFVGGMVADLVYGGIRPRNYANAQNAALKSALGLDSTDAKVSLQPVIVPSVNPANTSYGLSLSIRM